MTKEVKLRICGMHMHGEDGDRDDVEVISVGQMCERDGFAWITYEEVVEEEENGLVSVVKNLVKYKDDQLEIIKHGPAESHMVFVPNETTYSYYSTPVSSLGESNIQEQGKTVFFLHTVRNFHLTFIFQSEGKDIIIA